MKRIFIFSLLFLSSSGWLIKNPCSVSTPEKDSDHSPSDIKRVSDESSLREYKVSVKGVIFDRMTQNPVVILITEDENRFVPIWIGFAEAMSIDMVIKNIKPPRPMTHDLMKDMVEKFGAKIEKVSITDVRENTYFAVIKVRIGDKTLNIDSRPSDAIALALRLGTPIYITQKILDVSIRVPDEEKASRIWQVIGVSLQLITPELENFFGSKGIVISDVKKGSPADGKLRRGDIIIRINGKETLDERAINIVREEITKSKEVELSIIRNGERKNIKLEIPK